MNQDVESTGDQISSYTPVDEWSYQEKIDDKEPEVNYDPYLDIARLFHSHTFEEEGKDDQRNNINFGKGCDHLV